MVLKAIDMWCIKPTRTCAINYEISDSGTPHMHMVLEDTNKVAFSTIQKTYRGVYISPTMGNKKETEDYIYKRGKHEEKNHTLIVEPVFYGEIRSNQGKRYDLIEVNNLIEQGLTPNEIFDMSIVYRRYESLVKKAFFRKRQTETPLHRNVKV